MDWIKYLKLSPTEYNCWTFIEKIHPDLNKWNSVLQDLYERKKHKWGEDLSFEDINNILSDRQEINILDLQPYDILIFSINDKRPQHFGLYIGNNQFIHHRKNPKIDELNDEWRKRLKSIYR